MLQPKVVHLFVFEHELGLHRLELRDQTLTFGVKLLDEVGVLNLVLLVIGLYSVQLLLCQS